MDHFTPQVYIERTAEQIKADERKAAIHIIQMVIDMHPKGCVFLPNASERIYDLMGGKPLWAGAMQGGDPAYENHRKLLKRVFEMVEVYCPHEPNRKKHLWSWA